MALSPAEKMRAYRERQKANNQKQVSFLIDADIAETVTSYAEQHQTTQADIFNNLLRQSLSGNKLPSNDTVTSYQAELKELTRKNEILQIKVDNYARDIGNMNRRNSELESDLKAAKAKSAGLNNSELQKEIDRLNEKYSNLLNHNEKLVIERDIGKIEIQKLKNIVQGIDYQKIADKRAIEGLKKELEETQRKLFAGTNRVCQCITSNGTQCTRPADKLIQTNDLMIWTCKQHRAKYPNAARVV